MKLPSKYITIGIGIIVLGLIYYFFKSILLYIILASVVSLLGRRMTNLLVKIRIWKFTVPKALAAGTSLFVFWALVSLFLWVFVPLIVNEAQELSNINISAIEVYYHDPIIQLQNFTEKLNAGNQDFDIKSYVNTKITNVLSLEQVRSFFSSFVGTIGNVLIAVFAVSFISFFFLKDDRLLMKGILSFVADKNEQKVKLVIFKIIKLVSRYFTGLIIDVSAIIFLVTLGLWSIGIGFTHAIVIGLVAGFLNVIPYVGPIISMAFGTIVGTATKLTGAEVPEHILLFVLAIIAVFLVIQVIDAFFLQPLIYSNSVNATPLEIFLVILMAGTVGGIGGMIIAIPSYSIIRVIAKQTLSQFEVVEQLTKNI